MTRPRKLAAVAIPLHGRSKLTPDEETSLRHLEHYLGSHDRYLIAPRSLNVERTGYRVLHFSDRYFGSADANRGLLFSRSFYRSFLDYEFVLIYHLDALVLADELEYWCGQRFDYIGAPWFVDGDRPEKGFSRVGNGGFSLRRVGSFLRVMESSVYKMPPREYWRRYFAEIPWPRQIVGRVRTLVKHFRVINGVRWHLRQYRYNEDHFWADQPRRYDAEFRVADPETALRFAFEVAPRHCLKLTGGRLPFSCHAWPIYDREFWEPYLLATSPAGAGTARTDRRAQDLASMGRSF